MAMVVVMRVRIPKITQKRLNIYQKRLERAAIAIICKKNSTKKAETAKKR